MNIQTERLENQIARFTVEVGNDRFNDAKKQAARNIAKQYRIPGFRKGKAPYNVLVRHIGEAPIIEEAMEKLGNEVYLQALDQASEDIRPYGPGSLEDFKLVPEPTYIFTVPLEPEVELGEYRTLRKDYTAPEVSDEDVEGALLDMRRRDAETVESDAPVASGNRVTVDIHSEFADGEERAESSEEEADADSDDENEDNIEDEIDESAVPYKGDDYIHRHDQSLDLDPDNEPVLPGFIEALVGTNVDEDVEFELTVPDDSEYEEIRGRKVQFHVTVKKIEVVTMPELNDEFANHATEDEDEPLNLEQLRTRVRENLEAEAVRDAENKYANELVDEIVLGSTVKFPHVMLDDRIDEMLRDLDNNLRQQGIGLEDYMRITGATKETLHEQYAPEAEKSLTRSLVLGELLVAESIQVSAVDIDQQINDMLQQFGEQQETFRQFFDTPQQRQNITNNLLYERIMQRLTKIGRGEPIEEPVSEDISTDRVDAITVDDESASDVTPKAVSVDDESAEAAADESGSEDAAPDNVISEDATSAEKDS